MPRLSAEREIEIKIIKVNIYPPEISLAPVQITNGNAALVMENQPAGTFVSWLRVTDQDTSDFGLNNQKPTLRVEPNEYFKISDDVIVTRKSFDRETQDFYTLTVTACDAGDRCNESSLDIVIGDENDNNPIMEKDVLEFNIRENHPIGIISYSLDLI